MKRLALAFIALALAGCSGVTEEQIADKRIAIRALAVAQIDAWNAAGVDPLQMPAEKVALFSLSCATVAGVVALVPLPHRDVAEEDLTDRQRAQIAALKSAPASVADFCAVVAKALAPAPVPKPDPAA